ncbi:MAG: hypothetical protein GX225_07145 [Clostridiales bacterium]|nr:hypothetical protein [Clostridiales bacterium]
MYKTKLGLSNCMVAGIIFLLALVTNFMSASIIFAWPLVLLVAYVLLKEEDLWLKASAVKAVLVVLLFMMIPICFSFVNNIIQFINFFLGIAEATPIRDGWGVIAFFEMLFDIAEKIFLGLLAIMAFKGKTIKLPIVDGLIRKHLS